MHMADMHIGYMTRSTEEICKLNDKMRGDMNTTKIPEIGIYVACLSAYNNGKLHGVWIDATQHEHVIISEIKAMLASSTEPDAEEWAIHDHTGFEGANISENHNIIDLCETARILCQEHGPIIVKLMEHLGGNTKLAGAWQWYEDNYHGEWDSFQDYAENLLEDCGDLNSMPVYLRQYFDYEAYAKDLSNEYIVIKDYGKVHVFSKC